MTQVRGADSLRRKFHRLGTEAPRVLNKAAYAGGLVVQGKTVERIREYKQAEDALVDTGFMWNSVFTTGPTDSNYTRRNAAAKARNEQGKMWDEPTAKMYQAIVSVGAEYAAYLHEGTEDIPSRPFLRQAIDTSEKDVVRAVHEQCEKAIKQIVKRVGGNI